MKISCKHNLEFFVKNTFMKLFYQKKLSINTMTDKYGVKFFPISLKINVTQVMMTMMDMMIVKKMIKITILKFIIKALIVN